MDLPTVGGNASRKTVNANLDDRERIDMSLVGIMREYEISYAKSHLNGIKFFMRSVPAHKYELVMDMSNGEWQLRDLQAIGSYHHYRS